MNSRNVFIGNGGVSGVASINNSTLIRQEIQRFESVHPCIYALYDLIEVVADPLLQNRIREHIVCIEDSFVNSQEWTLSRTVPDIKLGIVGATCSGKSALVHRYLTGSYMPEESPEGGRFKKEVVVDGQSYLLLIRDEGGAPEFQFTQWVDGIILVFSLENEASFNAVYNYYTRMAQHQRMTSSGGGHGMEAGLNDIPFVLVGTQDAISESNPRVIDDLRARKLAADLKRCSYYETCATYGLNVERVFQDACQKIAQCRAAKVTPGVSGGGSPLSMTPTHNARGSFQNQFSHGGVGGGLKGVGGGYESQSNSSHSSVTSLSTGAAAGGGNTTSFNNQGGHSSPHHEVNSVLTHQMSGVVLRDKTDRTSRDVREREMQIRRVPQQVPNDGVFHYGNRQVPMPGHAVSTMVVPDLTLAKSASLPDPNLSLSAYIQQNPQVFSSRAEKSHSSLIPSSATPVLARKQKLTKNVQKSNSFNSPSLLHYRASLHLAPATEPVPVAPPFTTPILSRKAVNSGSSGGTNSGGSGGGSSGSRFLMKGFNPDISIFHVPGTGYNIENIDDCGASQNGEFAYRGGTGRTPLLGRRIEPRSRFSLILEQQQQFGVGEQVGYNVQPTNGVGGGDSSSPNSTPSQSRKNKRRSNIFTQKKTEQDRKLGNGSEANKIGSGRAIPCKQGFLYKKSGKPLSKDWKKKYVTLLDDGRLTYHPSIHDYMENLHSKEIALMRTTVKIPGGRPRGSEAPRTSLPPPPASVATNGKDGATADHASSASDLSTMSEVSLPPPDVLPKSSAMIGSALLRGVDTPNVKKKHRRAKSGVKSLDGGADQDSDGYEFVIVSLDNRQWFFDAATPEEREEWMVAIEQQILSSLQNNESNKPGLRCSNNSATDTAAAVAIRAVAGNSQCADCSTPNPDWASLNLGIVICIECSGIHRNLGTHLSRVRSLDLDEWPSELVLVMTAIGNVVANSVWENSVPTTREKPVPNSLREAKESWIRSKYEQKESIPPLPYPDASVTQQLIDAVARQDVQKTITVLAYCAPEHVNTPYSRTDTRTALHIVAAMGNPVLLQLLLWYGANVLAIDHEGNIALRYAHTSGSKLCVQLLRAQGSPDILPSR